jgi:hypothetical protein
MIFIKWGTNWTIDNHSSKAPSIIGLLMNMPLKLGSTVFLPANLELNLKEKIFSGREASLGRG